MQHSSKIFIPIVIVVDITWYLVQGYLETWKLEDKLDTFYMTEKIAILGNCGFRLAQLCAFQY